jgi:hypothetical protein
MDGIKKLLVVTPSLDGKVSIEYVSSLVGLKSRLFEQRVNCSARFHKGNSILFSARNHLMQDFIESDADAALLVDADITYQPSDIVDALRVLGDSIIGLPCSRKFPQWERAISFVRDNPEFPVERITSILGDANFGIENDTVQPDENGLVDVPWIGTGAMIVSRGAIQKIMDFDPAAVYYSEKKERLLYKFFSYRFDEKSLTYSGEDVGFCMLAKEAGVSLKAKIDAKTGHVGFIDMYFDALAVSDMSKYVKES